MRLGLLLPLAAACEPGLAPPVAQDAGVMGDVALVERRPLRWQRERAAVGPDGLTEAAHFVVPEGARVFALRAYSVLPRTTLDCFAARDVVVNGTETWVGSDTAADSGDYCATCQQRVSVGRGYGSFVLPSAGAAELVISTVSARIGLPDCQTLTPRARVADAPDALWVELSAWAAPEPTVALQLQLAVMLATRHGFAQDAALLPDALAALQRIWLRAGIQVEIVARVEIAEPPAPLAYSATDLSALVDVSRRARAALADGFAAAGPVLLLTPCLQRADLVRGGRTEPWAVTPHLPGGLAIRDEPDEIFVAAERCEGLTPSARFSDPALLGAVMAHELGHYFGLYHVTEHDGRQDMLVDTVMSEPNLMQATPSSSATALSQSQIELARRHPAFARAL
jgi:hypothetical protein